MLTFVVKLKHHGLADPPSVVHHSRHSRSTISCNLSYLRALSCDTGLAILLESVASSLFPSQRRGQPFAFFKLHSPILFKPHTKEEPSCPSNPLKPAPSTK